MFKSQRQRLAEDMRRMEMTPEMLKKYGMSHEEMDRFSQMSIDEIERDAANKKMKCEKDANEEEMKDREMAIDEMKAKIHKMSKSNHPDKMSILKKMEGELVDMTREDYSFNEVYMPAYYNNYNYFRPRRIWRWNRRRNRPYYSYYYRPYYAPYITGNNYFRPNAYMFSHVW